MCGGKRADAAGILKHQGSVLQRPTWLTASDRVGRFHKNTVIDDPLREISVTRSCAILSSLCTEFLSVNVSAILYLMNYEKYGRSTASAQYFLQLAGYLGIPVIAWNADNSGLERRASQSSLQLQLAPSLEHQTAAMLSILERYKWHQFSVVTSQIAGHDDFVQALRERITEMQDRFKFNILNTILVTKPGDLQELVNSESRVMLLYSTREEAVHILKAARDLKITGENYVWVVTQSVIENRETPSHFPVGMLGKSALRPWRQRFLPPSTDVVRPKQYLSSDKQVMDKG
ncbi:glutamate receptor ionotropic, NMDA 2B-like [Schistocerca nitens]|uniref:glutamate receptor ionotropic, NMDA 2B-like n=1 Tax=Schistocerca nitens TaxID=7011 RepID=UPI002118914C|nr:glutamate receptor ionotropic, NMDA 2B-like [Schistocerca nitens]